jgi:hypothetical protein
MRMAVTGLFLLALATATVAQMGMRPGTPTLRGVFHPVVGGGAQYAIQNADGKNMTMEIAIVGKESVGGKDGYWLEMTMMGTSMGEMVIKRLTVLDGNEMTASRVIMQMPGHPPMEMPEQMAQMHAPKQPADIRADAQDLGSESVTTPAGTFSCEHYRMKDGSADTWVSEKIAPFGLVKEQEKNSSIVLTKVISDAKDRITGTPQPFNPMMMMGPQPQAPEQ